MKEKLLAFGLVGALAASVAAAQVSGFVGYRGGPAWRTYLEGDFGRIAQPQIRVITSESQWQRYWQEQFAMPGLVTVAPRDVDFRQEMLVAIHIGRQSTWGHGVYVRAVRPEGPDRLVVEYVVQRPDPRMGWARGENSPFVIVRLPRQTARLEFRAFPALHRGYGDRWRPPCPWTCPCPCRCGASDR